MSPLPANDTGAPVTLADLLTQAADLQRQIDAVEAARAVAIASRLRDRIAVADGPMFGAATLRLAVETGRACAFPAEEGDGQ